MGLSPVTLSDAKQESIPFFELSLSILSSIGLCLTGVSIWAIFITRFTPLHAVPLFVSAACAVANGLHYYAFYTPSPEKQEAAAGVFADIFCG
ncbi:hypothetical protein FE257_003006 [Aspergillus nanangensis]|uniref:Uncharacterized protein n=1 Tax=Aspergillus nanangensis TaxID=2582783 RepID=A0AAD4GNS7_ASPNN|nr:hypothetical protein FE257_003006 [Aspergillus nanangensis]